jgi:hypothetical protein
MESARSANQDVKNPEPKGRKANKCVMVDDENEMQDNLAKAKKPNKVTIRLAC